MGEWENRTGLGRDIADLFDDKGVTAEDLPNLPERAWKQAYDLVRPGRQKPGYYVTPGPCTRNVVHAILVERSSGGS